jgi:rod shape-determining protein MreC
MLKRPHYIAAGIAALLALLVLNLPERTTARLKLAIGGLFLPLFGLVGVSREAADSVGDRVVPRAELNRHNETLQRENQQLRLQLTQAAQAEQENARLRQLLGWQQRAPWKLKLAKVVLRDPANWWKTIQIDLGSRDGVVTNAAVLTTNGLVGRVTAVSYTRAQVVLLGDPNCRVSALVENETRDTGVISAGGVFDGAFVDLGYLSRNAALKSGQNVITSGLGGIFPAGINIGKVVDMRPANYGLYAEAQVKLAVNFGALEEVWVMVK